MQVEMELILLHISILQNSIQSLLLKLKTLILIDYFDKKAARRLDRFCQFAIATSVDGYEGFRYLILKQLIEDRFGVIYGSGIGGMKTTAETSI
ncbi:MAG: hypothetical protein MZV64_67640 [Ignavibacteriales bacterium]|nr:hypothetical protein [Ignavibacteriales bacterium]